MATFIQGRFKIFFTILLLVVFTGLISVHWSNIKASKAWLTSFYRNLHYLFSPTNISTGNQVLLKRNFSLQHKPTPRIQIPNTIRADVTMMTRLSSVVQSTNQDATRTKVPLTQYYHEAYPRKYHFILDEPDICEQQKPFLVLMVPVSPQGLEARNAIRSSWGNESVVQGKNVTVLFMLGLTEDSNEAKQKEQLTLESQQYHDLIQSTFKDTYKNLTIKTMVIMDWLATRCRQASYAMKVDSDMFLNLENLMSMLLAPDTPKEKYMTGLVKKNQPVIRNKNSKWYVPKEMYPKDVYPTYLLGMGYVFSNDLPELLIDVSKDIQPFHIEDAYMGECLNKLGISPSSPPNPSQFKAYYNGKSSKLAQVITTILRSPKQLVTLWQELKRPT